MCKCDMYICDHMSEGENVEACIRSLTIVPCQRGVQRGCRGEKRGKMSKLDDEASGRPTNKF